MKAHFSRLFIAFCLATLTYCAEAVAQERTQPALSRSILCSRERALTIIEDQIALTRANDSPRRITVLVRAADMVWPHKQKRARLVFAEAFEAARQDFKEKGERSAREGQLFIALPDQRYAVISAIARRDSQWAKKLAEQLLKEQHDAPPTDSKDPREDTKTAERLLILAASTISTDPSLALHFARSSFQYPATLYLSQFFYQLASVNRSASDQFYVQALAVYSRAPMERLLYLSSYPFGNSADAGETPGSMIYEVPAGFVGNPDLQRMFMQVMLSRAQESLNNPLPPEPTTGRSEQETLWLALARLQPQVQQTVPDLGSAVEAAKRNLFAQLPQAAHRATEPAGPNDSAPKESFNERIETALKNPNVDRRDQLLTSAILYGAKSENLGPVLAAVDKISDSALRQPLLNWLYFDRASQAIGNQKFDEARKLAANVEELDQRAFLYYRIADESLKKNHYQTESRDMLEEVVAATAKAPNTTVSARALLGVAYLYSKFDVNRAVSVMAEAVKLINRAEQADFSRQFVIRRIEGKIFGTYASIVTPGFNPENAFREIGKVELDGMLSQASSLSDTSLRAMCILALVEQCLKDEQPRRNSASEIEKLASRRSPVINARLKFQVITLEGDRNGQIDSCGDRELRDHVHTYLPRVHHRVHAVRTKPCLQTGNLHRLKPLDSGGVRD